MARSRSLADLAARIEAIEGGRVVRAGETHEAWRALATGWPHQSASHLAGGSLHEFLGVLPGETGGRGMSAKGRWTPPLFILSHLARCAAERDDEGAILWIGSRIHPYVAVLRSEERRDGRSFLKHSFFIGVDDLDLRVWAIDLALRSPAIGIVIADGSGVTMAQSRRLQLAAQARGAIALLARPGWERKEHSCAATRWEVARTPSYDGSGPRWVLTCVRCKGVQRGSAMEADSSSLILERCRATGRIRVAADVCDRPDQAAIA